MSFAEFTGGLGIFGLLWAMLVTPLMAMVWSMAEPEEQLKARDVAAIAGFCFAMAWFIAAAAWVHRWGFVWTHA